MRRLAAALTAILFAAACTSSTSVASRSPEASPSASEAPSASASPIASPSAPASVPPLVVAGLPVHNGEVGLGYTAVTFLAGGGVPPYTWSGSGGTVPGGLSISSGGQLKGTPSAAGAYSFSVKVTDSAGHSATGSTKVTIYSALKVSAACATQCYVGTGCKKCWGFGTASGGLAPYTYKAIGGSAPASYGALSLTAPPAKPGQFSLTVQVTDALGVSQQVKANWTIYGPATLTAGSSCINLGNPPQCSTTGWSYKGGSPTTAPKLVVLKYSTYCDVNGFCYPVPSVPPQGWTVTFKGGTIVFSAGGLPCSPNVPYGAVITVALVDGSACATTSQSNSAQLTVFLENNC